MQRNYDILIFTKTILRTLFDSSVKNIPCDYLKKCLYAPIFFGLADALLIKER